MPWHNKVLRKVEIFDFVTFREVLIIHCSPDLTRTCREKTPNVTRHWVFLFVFHTRFIFLYAKGEQNLFSLNIFVK